MQDANTNDNCNFFPYILISRAVHVSPVYTDTQTGYDKVVEGHAWVGRVIFFLRNQSRRFIFDCPIKSSEIERSIAFDWPVCKCAICSLQVCNSAVCSMQVCNSAVCSLQSAVCSLQVCKSAVCKSAVCMCRTPLLQYYILRQYYILWHAKPRYELPDTYRVRFQISNFPKIWIINYFIN